MKIPAKFIPRIRLILILSILSLQTGAFSQANKVEVQSPTAKQMMEWVRYLASEKLEGRASGSEGNNLAARFIANYFKEMGVQTLNGSYFQKFPVETEIKLAPGNGVKIVEKNSENREWKAANDYIPLSFSKDTTVSANVAFAGFGITDEKIGYDDYKGVDVNGKWVIILTGIPENANSGKKFAGKTNIRYKVLNARNHHAAGVILVNNSEDADSPLPKLRPSSAGKSAGVAVLQVRREKAAALFPAGKSLNETEKSIRDSLQPGSFAIPGIKIEGTIALNHLKKPTANVIGWVPGTNPAWKNQYLVVGAHFDHLGWGGSTSLDPGKKPAIHFGADDNASGTAAMMELAGVIAKNPLPRPVIFMGFTGEEMGVLGSSYYATHPLRPIKETIFMLNMDMVGRLKDGKLNVQGTGTAQRWNALVDSLGTVFNLQISKSADGYGPSDHSSFYAQKIPVLFMFTGLHEDYHRPSDTWDKINYDGMVTVVDFARAIVQSIASAAQPPQYVQATPDQKRGRAVFKVYVGTIPDYSDNPYGLRITGVRKDSPAEKAGLKGGDIIVKFGETPIQNIYDYTYSLGDFKPGDKVDVVVLRGTDASEKIKLHLVLSRRK